MVGCRTKACIILAHPAMNSNSCPGKPVKIFDRIGRFEFSASCHNMSQALAHTNRPSSTRRLFFSISTVHPAIAPAPATLTGARAPAVERRNPSRRSITTEMTPTVQYVVRNMLDVATLRVVCVCACVRVCVCACVARAWMVLEDGLNQGGI